MEELISTVRQELSKWEDEFDEDVDSFSLDGIFLNKPSNVAELAIRRYLSKDNSQLRDELEQEVNKRMEIEQQKGEPKTSDDDTGSEDTNESSVSDDEPNSDDNTEPNPLANIIDGVGTRKIATLKEAGYTVDNINSANFDDLVSLSGIGESTAQKIIDQFNDDDTPDVDEEGVDEPDDEENAEETEDDDTEPSDGEPDLDDDDDLDEDDISDIIGDTELTEEEQMEESSFI